MRAVSERTNERRRTGEGRRASKESRAEKNQYSSSLYESIPAPTHLPMPSIPSARKTGRTSQSNLAFERSRGSVERRCCEEMTTHEREEEERGKKKEGGRRYQQGFVTGQFFCGDGLLLLLLIGCFPISVHWRNT